MALSSRLDAMHEEDRRRATTQLHDAARAVEVAKADLQNAIVNAVEQRVDYRIIDQAMTQGYDAGVAYRKDQA